MKVIKDLTIMSVLTGTMFVLELALSSIPSVQLTFLLILIYSKLLGTPKTMIMIFIHVLLDTFLFGGLMSFYMGSMLFGYMLIPIMANTVFKRVENVYVLGLFSGLSAVLYAWSFIPPTMLLYNVNLWLYLIADIPFTAVLVVNNFIATIVLYKPLTRIFKEYFLGEV